MDVLAFLIMVLLLLAMAAWFSQPWQFKRTLVRSLTILNGYGNGKRRKVKPRSSEQERRSLRRLPGVKMHDAGRGVHVVLLGGLRQ
jgi:hypothetical protein